MNEAPDWKAASMLGFRILLVAIWLVVAAVTLWALTKMGLLAYPRTFIGDLSHPWRAQFYSDLSAHLFLVAGWIAHRERSRARGLMFAAATLLVGALFTFPYIFWASLRAGNARTLLLGEGAAR
jgi:tellurite resistance protein TehA-like permease